MIAAAHWSSGVPLFPSHQCGTFRTFPRNAMGGGCRDEADVQPCGVGVSEAHDRIVKDHGSCQRQLPADCAIVVGASSACPHQ